MLAWGSSKVRLKGTELLQNTAADAGGGAIALQQDSTLECDGTSFINNTARGNGGALFVGSALFQSQNIPVSFRGNTLFEGNVAENEGEGGAIYSNRPIEFMPGGFSAARRNSAHGMGGAVLLSDCELVLGYGHQIEASHNEVNELSTFYFVLLLRVADCSSPSSPKRAQVRWDINDFVCQARVLTLVHHRLDLMAALLLCNLGQRSSLRKKRAAPIVLQGQRATAPVIPNV